MRNRRQSKSLCGAGPDRSAGGDGEPVRLHIYFQGLALDTAAIPDEALPDRGAAPNVAQGEAISGTVYAIGYESIPQFTRKLRPNVR